MKASGLLSAWTSGSSRATRVLLIAMLMTFCSAGLHAQPPQTGQAAEQSGEALSQREALELVRARFPGNIISINEVNQDGRIRFRIRIDNEGNIYTVYVDQATGAITRE